MNKWIDITKKRPKNGKDVLVYYKEDSNRSIVFIAAYFGRYELECNDDSFGYDIDYHDISDEYFAPEGWYEYSESNEEFSYTYLIKDITHWMDKPEPPKELK